MYFYQLSWITFDHLNWTLLAGAFCSVFRWTLQCLAWDCPGYATLVWQMNGHVPDAAAAGCHLASDENALVN